MGPLVSVVIPTWNESERIARCVEQFQSLKGTWEIIVADGGSSDETPQIAMSLGARVVPCDVRGRGPQQNAGARVARGGLLLFLHADAMLPEHAYPWITNTLLQPAVSGGAFRVRHDTEGHEGWRARLLRVADLRSRWTRSPYGDQAIFMKATIFHACGGFLPKPLMEDVALVRELNKLGRVRIVPAEVHVSSRRFDRGLLRAFLCMTTFPMLDRIGVSPRILMRLYGNPR